jgi:hypothetical protein
MGEYAAVAAIITAPVSTGTAVMSAQAAQQQGKVARRQAELQAQAYAEQRQAVADAAEALRERQERAAIGVVIFGPLSVAATYLRQCLPLPNRAQRRRNSARHAPPARHSGGRTRPRHGKSKARHP